MLSILRILKYLILLFLLGSTELSYGIFLKFQWGSYYGGDPDIKTSDSMSFYLDNRLPSMRSAEDQVAGYMLKLSLCDSLTEPIVWAMDSAYCPNEIIDIQLSLAVDSVPSSYIYWHSSLGDSVQRDSFYIQKPGWYFSEIRSVYTDCPSFFSDTLFVDTIPILQVNFGIDSLELCAQNLDFVLTAANPFAQYLWSNGSTDSIFQVKYKGMAEFWIWGEAYTRCADTARDSVFVQFLPPYAYLGEDTMLCPNERFYFDIAAQNEEYKELLAYRWKINGDGFNDTLELRTAEKIFDFEIKIYNTYARLVHPYTGEPMDFRWDGFSKLLAQPLADGTYYWIALFRDYLNKKKTENGIITILRQRIGILQFGTFRLLENCEKKITFAFKGLFVYGKFCGIG